MTTSKPPAFLALLFACLLPSLPSNALAFELSGGLSVGGIQIGTEPRLALSPFVSLLWNTQKGLLFELHQMFSILPGPRVGIYDRTAANLGYAWKTGNLSFGPSLSIYSMPVCGAVICDRVVGIAPGVHAKGDWYFAEPLGASVSANLDWARGSSRILSDALVVMVTAGPILRLQLEAK